MVGHEADELVLVSRFEITLEPHHQIQAEVGDEGEGVPRIHGERREHEHTREQIEAHEVEPAQCELGFRVTAVTGFAHPLHGLVGVALDAVAANFDESHEHHPGYVEVVNGNAETANLLALDSAANTCNRLACGTIARERGAGARGPEDAVPVPAADAGQQLAHTLAVGRGVVGQAKSDGIGPNRQVGAILEHQLELDVAHYLQGGGDPVAAIKKYAASGNACVISTLNGDTNVPFFKEFANAGLTSENCPVVSFSISEDEFRGLPAKQLVGQLGCWTYFQSIKSPANTEFVKKWSDYAKAKGIAGHKDKPLTNDPMEATYLGIMMWKAAVEKAKSTDTDKVIAAMAGQTYAAPGGFTSTMDKENHHLHKPVFIGEVKADGQFNVVWKTPGPVKAKPWSPFIEGNDKKKDEPEKK